MHHQKTFLQSRITRLSIVGNAAQLKLPWFESTDHSATNAMQSLSWITLSSFAMPSNIPLPLTGQGRVSC